MAITWTRKKRKKRTRKERTQHGKHRMGERSQNVYYCIFLLFFSLLSRFVCSLLSSIANKSFSLLSTGSSLSSSPPSRRCLCRPAAFMNVAEVSACRENELELSGEREKFIMHRKFDWWEVVKVFTVAWRECQRARWRVWCTWISCCKCFAVRRVTVYLEKCRQAWMRHFNCMLRFNSNLHAWQVSFMTSMAFIGWEHH